MRLTRTVWALTTFGIGIVAAACSSSKATGPSAASLAAKFDSLFKADSAANRGASAELESFALLSLDEGFTPTKASVTTDAGALAMEFIGVALYDTASGAPADSDLFTIGWTSDYNTYLLTVLQVTAADRIPRHRLGVSAQQLETLRALAGRPAAGGPVRARSTSSSGVVLVEGDSAVDSDTASVVVSEISGNGKCTYENVAFTNFFGFDLPSASCNAATVSLSFVLHFPAHGGIDAGLEHMTLTPAVSMKAARILVAG
jgi:hypothetical protein